VKSFAKVVGQLVNIVRPVNFDGLACRVEDHFAVFALVHMGLNFGANRGGDAFVNQIVEESNKLSAGHFSSTPLPAVLPVRPSF